MNDFAIKARYLFPVSSEPIRQGLIEIRGGRIVSVGAPATSLPLVDLRNSAVLPGLINAHTHLEFSDLDQPLPPRGPDDRGGMAHWIESVVHWRRSADQSPDVRRRRVRSAVLSGMRECLRQGVTTVGEINTDDDAVYPPGGSRIRVFRELLGLSRERVEPLLDIAEAHLAAYDDRRPTGGLSPHAPYTVHAELLDRTVELSARRGAVVAMHLAESREELELLSDGRGPLVQTLERLGAWSEDAIPRGSRPLDYLRRLRRAHRALVVHGNYFDDDEIQFLATHRESMSLVYCPRTHAAFGHERYPLGEMLDAGVVVALGTDSRASNPDLSLLSEMRHVAAAGVCPPRRVLAMATIDAARALGLSHEAGVLEPGRSADLAVIALPDREDPDPHDLLFDSELPVVDVFVAGRRGGEVE